MHRPSLPRRAPALGWRPLVLVVAAVVIAAAGWMWLRDSSLARVQRVYITGLSSPDEVRIRRALEDAASDMTTLHVRSDALRAAVSAFPSVTALDTDSDFPHALTITVHERRAVATLDAPGRPVPVAPDGTLLNGMRPDPSLPVLRQGAGARPMQVADAAALLAAAPATLLQRASGAWTDNRGLVVALRHGPTLVFGSRSRPRAKWAAAARVLAEGSAAGAVYLDLRVPERVAAGGLPSLDLDLDSSVS